MPARLVVKSAKDEIGAVRRRPLRAIEDQIIVARLGGIDVEVRAEETAALVMDLVETAGGRCVIDVKTAAEGGDTVLAIADQRHAQGRVRRQNERCSMADNQATAVLAQRANNGDKMAEIAAFAQLAARAERLDALQQPAL